MSHLTLDYSPSATHTTTHRIIRRFRATLRWARRRSNRRRMLRQILDNKTDSRALADIGVSPPVLSLLERFPQALTDIRR